LSVFEDGLISTKLERWLDSKLFVTLTILLELTVVPRSLAYFFYQVIPGAENSGELSCLESALYYFVRKLTDLLGLDL
jgi:hypothetical protein